MFLTNLAYHIPGTPSFIFHKQLKRGSQKVWMLGEPNEAMKLLHQRLILDLRQFLYYQSVEFPHATCFQRGDSIHKNVEPHLRNRYFFVTDIHDAYRSVDTRRLAVVLCDLFPRLNDDLEAIRAFLLRYCLYSPRNNVEQTDDCGARGLVVGAPASPFLFNLYVGVCIDRRLHDFCQQHGVVYTRYLDDLTFSRHHRAITGDIRQEIQRIVTEADLNIAHHKSRVIDLKHQPLLITGLSLRFIGHGQQAIISTSRRYLQRLNGLFHKVLQGKAPHITTSHVRGFLGFMQYASNSDRPIRSGLWLKVYRLGHRCLKVLASRE